VLLVLAIVDRSRVGGLALIFCGVDLPFAVIRAQVKS